MFGYVFNKKGGLERIVGHWIVPQCPINEADIVRFQELYKQVPTLRKGIQKSIKAIQRYYKDLKIKNSEL